MSLLHITLSYAAYQKKNKQSFSNILYQSRSIGRVAWIKKRGLEVRTRGVVEDMTAKK